MPDNIKFRLSCCVIFLLAAFGIASLANQLPFAIDAGQPGGPVRGLSFDQVRKFNDAKALFTHNFTPEEGLGPLFNGSSCFECHGQPAAIGGEGRDVTSTGVVRIGKRLSTSKFAHADLFQVKDRLTLEDVDLMFNSGGPALQRKSITSEFIGKYPIECQSEIAVAPRDAELVSLRHAPPLFGFGLIEAIPDAYITQNALEQASQTPDLLGRVSPHEDPLSHQVRLGRFGWKNQHATLLSFTAEALNVEMGITSYIRPMIKSARASSELPSCLRKYLPHEPNDNGSFVARLAYFQALLAPPERGPLTTQAKQGERLFERLQCSVCHKAQTMTASTVYLPDPESPFPTLRWLEIPALENQPVRAYSDFLLHKMGKRLADGLPQEGSSGGEWRTTPLWGVRFKKFYLHDGSAKTLDEAIRMHGGQAQRITDSYEHLSEAERTDLVAFLKTL